MIHMKRFIAWLDRLPYDLLALVARIATCVVFWRSGQVKLDDWSATLGLFETEYRLPLLPPHLAAYLATGLELGGSVLVLTGLGTRFAALAFLGMVATIQFLVYPSAWPTHVQWVAFLLPLIARGPGRLSLDALLKRLAR
jgi:putative oxidoreductase